MSHSKEEQLGKLARTLVNSGLAFTLSEAMKKAREILKIPEEPAKEEPVDVSTLPKVDDISPVEKTTKYSVGASDIDTDKTLKEVLEEDAEKIYEKQDGSGRQPE